MVKLSLSTSIPCVFCDIAAKKKPAAVVFEDENCLIFLDKKPLFPGHCLLIPSVHYANLLDIPNSFLPEFSQKIKKLAVVVKEAMAAQGVFVAMNNIVSQSVLHAHVHVVPRNKGDGLKGFFWPRSSYQEGGEEATLEKLRVQWQKLDIDDTRSY